MFVIKAKYTFSAKKDTVTFKGLSQVLLSRLCKTCSYITQLSLKSCKIIGLNRINTGHCTSC